MTHALVTGAAGFVGRAVTRALVRRGRLTGPDGEAPIARLTLVDRRAFDAPPAPFEVHAVTSSLGTADVGALVSQADSIFHLAAALALEAERDVAVGWSANLHLPLAILEAARASGRRPRLIYASSIAVFGGAAPERVTEEHVRNPRTSYGTAKSIVELLLADYARHGFVDGRALRLPIVLTRLGTPTASVSDIVAEVVRGPLLGRIVVSPLDPQVPFAVVSVDRAAESLVELHERPPDSLPDARTIHQPGLTTTPRDLVDALERVAGEPVAGRVSFAPDAGVVRVVKGWPSIFASDAPQLFATDPDVDTIVRAAAAVLR